MSTTKSAAAAREAAATENEIPTAQEIADPRVSINVAKAAWWTLSVTGLPDPDEVGRFLPFPRAEHHRETVGGALCRRKCAPDWHTQLVLMKLASLMNERGEAFHSRLTREIMRTTSLSASTIGRELALLRKFFPSRVVLAGQRFPKRLEYDKGRECWTHERHAEICQHGRSVVYDLSSLFELHPDGDEGHEDYKELGVSMLEALSARHTLTPAARITRAMLSAYRNGKEVLCVPCGNVIGRACERCPKCGVKKGPRGERAWPGLATLQRRSRLSKSMLVYAMREQEGGPPRASIWPSARYVSKRDRQTHFSQRRAACARSTVPVMRTLRRYPGEAMPDGCGVVRLGVAERILLPLPKPSHLSIVSSDATAERHERHETETSAASPAYAVRQITMRYEELFGRDGDEREWAALCRQILVARGPKGQRVTLSMVLRALDSAHASDWYMKERAPHRRRLRALIGDYASLARCGGDMTDVAELADEISRQRIADDAERAAAATRMAEWRAYAKSGKAGGMTAPKPKFVDKST